MTGDGPGRSRRAVLGGLSTGFLASLAGCAVSTPIGDVSVGDDEPATTRTTTTHRTTDPPTESPTTTTEAPTYPLGETVSLTQQETTIDATVRDSRLTESYRTASDALVEAPSGAQYLFVEFEVTNTGSEDGAAPSVGVQPTSGSADRPKETPAWMSSGWYPAGMLEGALPAGSTIRGWIRRRVAVETTLSEVRVAISPDVLITEDEYRWRVTA